MIGRKERDDAIGSKFDGVTAMQNPEDWENFDHFVFHRGSRVPVFADDYGQSYYFYYGGKVHGCGSFCGAEEADSEVRDVIDWRKDIYDVVEDKKNGLWIEVFRERGIKRLFGMLYFYPKGGNESMLKIRCTTKNYRVLAESEMRRFIDFINSPERKEAMRQRKEKQS